MPNYKEFDLDIQNIRNKTEREVHGPSTEPITFTKTPDIYSECRCTTRCKTGRNC